MNICEVDFRLKEYIFLLKTCLKIRSDDEDVIMVMAMKTFIPFFVFFFRYVFVMEKVLIARNFGSVFHNQQIKMT